MSRTAGRQIGAVTAPNVRQSGTRKDADTPSNSGSSWRTAAAALLRDAGADFVVDGVSDLLPVVERIAARLARGDGPGVAPSRG